MKVWVNKSLNGSEAAWGAEGSRFLRLINNTGKTGKMFENIYLGYRRSNRTHFIFISKHRAENRMVEKECGIWVSECNYDVVGNESFTGKTKGIKNAGIVGRFGIYDLGTEILCDGRTWKLKEGKGWVISCTEAI